MAVQLKIGEPCGLKNKFTLVVSGYFGDMDSYYNLDEKYPDTEENRKVLLDFLRLFTYIRDESPDFLSEVTEWMDENGIEIDEYSLPIDDWGGESLARIEKVSATYYDENSTAFMVTLQDC